MGEGLKDLLRQFERVAVYQYGRRGDRLGEDKIDGWEERFLAAAGAGMVSSDTGPQAEFTQLQRPEFRRARATEAMLRKVLEEWARQLRAELTAEPDGPRRLPVPPEKAEEWVRSGDVHKHTDRTPTSVEQWKEVHEAWRVVIAGLDFMKEKGLWFRLQSDDIEWLPTPRGGAWVPVWTESPQGHLTRAVGEMAEYAGYTLPDLVSYVLTDQEPELKAVSVTVWRRPAPTGDGPMHSYATIRLNEAPTVRELEGLRRDLLEQWEKPRERKERLVRRIMKPIIGEPGNWSVEHPWSMEYWKPIEKDYNQLGIEEHKKAGTLKRWAHRRWATK